MALSVTRVVNALLCSDELYCPLHQSGVAVAGATNAVNKRQSEAVRVSLFFSSPRPYAFYPISPTHGHFVLSPVSLASRDQDGGLSDSTSTISRENRGLWTVYLKHVSMLSPRRVGGTPGICGAFDLYCLPHPSSGIWLRIWVPGSGRLLFLHGGMGPSHVPCARLCADADFRFVNDRCHF